MASEETSKGTIVVEDHEFASVVEALDLRLANRRKAVAKAQEDGTHASATVLTQIAILDGFRKRVVDASPAWFKLAVELDVPHPEGGES